MEFLVEGSRLIRTQVKMARCFRYCRRPGRSYKVFINEGPHGPNKVFIPYFHTVSFIAGKHISLTVCLGFQVVDPRLIRTQG